MEINTPQNKALYTYIYLHEKQSNKQKIYNSIIINTFIDVLLHFKVNYNNKIKIKKSLQVRIKYIYYKKTYTNL